MESLANGWYRVAITGTVVAANTNEIRITPDTIVGTGTVYAWGAQAENAIVPSSYIKTEGSTVTRNADSLYFPFTATPQAMTVYARGVERELSYTSDARILYVGDAAGNNPRIFVRSAGTSNRWSVSRVDGAGAVTQATSTQPVTRGQSVEARAVLNASGGIYLGISVASAAEVVSSTAAGTSLEASWSGPRIYVGPPPVGNGAAFAFTHVCVAAGEQSMDTMRQLAGVA